MGEETDRWKKLGVWQVADDFAENVYRLTRRFPREELYGITSQLRRAALSVPTNIVEGYSRRGDRELVRFLDIALGPLQNPNTCCTSRSVWDTYLKKITDRFQSMPIVSVRCYGSSTTESGSDKLPR